MKVSFLKDKIFGSFFVTVNFVFISFFIVTKVYAETVSGGGYSIDQIISPIGDTVSGGNYTVNQSGQISGDVISGGSYQSQGVFGKAVTPTELPPVVNSSFSSSGSYWGYYILPTETTSTTTIATVSPVVNKETVLTTNGSTCSTRIVILSPIYFGLKNDPIEVKKLETFLNTYEGEHLLVDGFYSKSDWLAVKRWQAKYKAKILTPILLKNPTGAVYISSVRQIERQTTASCGQPIVVHACPYFKQYEAYGDIGEEVKKIQQFLNIVRGENLPVNGKYGPATRDAVQRFQQKYKKEIVSFWSLSFMLGNWNITTRVKANQVIGCDVVK